MSQNNLLAPVYAGHLNSLFHHTTKDGQAVDFELVNIETHAAPPSHESFALTFRAPSDFPPLQGVYTLEHDKMESGEIFLVPISRDQNGVLFEAVFNRLLD
ncbi:MAG: hypothetical protein QOD00_3360 [Blastocatellia bacterium]|jgi:hypothetical protein|nr:hypothetical protein [Blastocatellia bacterium]